MKKEFYRIHMIKENGTYKETYKDTEKETVISDLAKSIVAKKFNGCTWIKRIVRTCNYDGTYTYKIYQDNNHMDIYRVDF